MERTVKKASLPVGGPLPPQERFVLSCRDAWSQKQLTEQIDDLP